MFLQNGPKEKENKDILKRARLWLADLPNGLSGRLLVLTILVVMIVEVIVFLPSVARHRDDWLMERIGAAQIATIALEVAGDQAIVPDKLRREILMRAEVEGVSVKRDNTRQLVLRPDMTSPIDVQYDLRSESVMDMVIAAMGCLMSTENRLMRVISEGRYGGDDTIEIILHEAPLQTELRGFAPRTFWQWLLSKPATSRTKVYYGPSWASAFMYSREGEFPAFPEAQAIELHRRAIEDVKYAEQFASDWDAS